MKNMERPILNKELDSKTFRDFFADNKGKYLEDAIQSMLLGTFMLIPGIIAYY